VSASGPFSRTPWRVERHEPISDVGKYSKPFFTVRDHQGRYVAAVDPFEVDELQNQGVANLIAAAPELLEVAKQLASDMLLSVDLARAARKAVAKAEGIGFGVNIPGTKLTQPTQPTQPI